MDVIIGLGVFVFLLVLGLLVGGSRERSHFRNLQHREGQTRDMVVTQTKDFLLGIPGASPPQMLVAEVVIATDYLKSYLASWRNLFGGEVRSYRTLMERARREAVLRIVEQARQLGYNGVCNIRLQTADVGGNTNTRGAAMAAILASGTAYHAQKPAL